MQGIQYISDRPVRRGSGYRLHAAIDVFAKSYRDYEDRDLYHK
jgi:hypothetical protein